jgi:exosome complex component RRP46
MGLQVALHPLRRADGSAVFSDGLYTVIAGVNGPIEVQRRDEIPDEAAIEVNIRPGAGVGGPRERWLENIVHAVIRSVLLVNQHPRTLMQITLQIAKEPQGKSRQTTADIAILPTLINASFISLVDSGLPLGATMSAVLAISRDNREVVYAPQEKDLLNCRSVHAFAFNQDGEQLFEQSSGEFDLELWEKIADGAQSACLAAAAVKAEDSEMVQDAGVHSDMQPWLRQALEDRAKAVNAWRTDP